MNKKNQRIHSILVDFLHNVFIFHSILVSVRSYTEVNMLCDAFFCFISEIHCNYHTLMVLNAQSFFVVLKILLNSYRVHDFYLTYILPYVGILRSVFNEIEISNQFRQLRLQFVTTFRCFQYEFLYFS